MFHHPRTVLSQLQGLVWLLLAWTLVLPEWAPAQESRPAAQAATAASIDTTPLRQIEQRGLPACLVDGPARFANLTDYYWAENQGLQRRFEQARQVYEDPARRPFRAVTLVAGAAGIGKTFFKGEAFRRDYPAEAVCKFDMHELYNEWQKDGSVLRKPDLSSGDTVINSLPALAEPQEKRLTEYMASRQAAFYVIDSLDEIHPDDYRAALSQIEEFALRGDRPFVHVVVFGRSLAFLDYWQARPSPSTTDGQDVALYILQPPVFRTTGDLLVSSWNYHGFRYKLSWNPGGGAAQAMPLDAYRQWAAAGYVRTGKFASVQYEANEDMQPVVQQTLVNWAKTQPIVGGTLYNLAGNGLLREIVSRHVQEHRPFHEHEVMREFLAACLERDTQSDNRPSVARPQYLDLYLQLLEETAAKYLTEGRIDERGYFEVRPDDQIQVTFAGKTLQFSVQRILNRSGVKHIDLLAPGGPRYSFEPIWFHRLLVEMRNERNRSGNG